MVVIDSMPNFLPSMSFRIREGVRSDTGSTEGGVKSFVNGIVSPFTNCWQPPMESCAPACGTSRYRYFEKSPAVVSPSRPTQAETPSTPVRDVPPSNSETSEATTDIENPHSNDVLCGRGGSSNRHLGNMHFRELVAVNKKTYVGLTKKQKMLVARKIVSLVHRTEPPGRFLAKDSDTGLWYDIGLPRSLEKTSQALREKNSNDVPDGAPTDLSVPALLHSPGRKASDDSKTSKTVKNVEAPPLTVPPHLMEVFYPRKAQEGNTAQWSNIKPQFRQIEQPYLRSHTPNCPGSPPQSYQVPPRGQSMSSFTDSPESPYCCSPRYVRQDSPPQDYRDHYDYYPGRSDHSEHYYSHSMHGRLQPPRRYRPYPYSPMSPASHQAHRPRNHYHQSPHMVPRVPIRPAMRQTPPRRYYDDDHSSYGRPYPSTPPQSARCGSPPMVYRTPSVGYARSRPELSSESRQEWKRQRGESGVVRRLSDTSLSTAVKDSLTIEESAAEVASPSGLLQSRSHKIHENGVKNKKKENSVECGNLAGLAVLTQAAFLKLDETL